MLQVPAGMELCDIEDAADVFWILHQGELSIMGPTGKVGPRFLHRLLGDRACFPWPTASASLVQQSLGSIS